jgi:hypothetical protein
MMEEILNPETAVRGFVLKTPKGLKWSYCIESKYESEKQDISRRDCQIVGEVAVKLGPKSQYDFILDIGDLVGELEKGTIVDVQPRLKEIEHKYK